MIYAIHRHTKEHREISEDLLAVGIPDSQDWRIVLAGKDGWIKWGGGEKPPLPYGHITDVMHRDGSVHVMEMVGKDFAEDWEHEPETGNWPHDIVAYRPDLDEDDEPEARNAKGTCTESDKFNCKYCARAGEDCAGPVSTWKPEAPYWNSEGLPPVGCVFEAFVEDEWRPMRCVAVDCGAVFAWDTGEPVGIDSTFVKMRPIRSAEDRTVEDIAEIIAKHSTLKADGHYAPAAARALYRAGYRRTDHDERGTRS